MVFHVLTRGWRTSATGQKTSGEEAERPVTDWIFQGNGKHYDLEARIAASRSHSWRTPRYRDRTAAGDPVWLQVAGRTDPGAATAG